MQRERTAAVKLCQKLCTVYMIILSEKNFTDFGGLTAKVLSLKYLGLHIV